MDMLDQLLDEMLQRQRDAAIWAEQEHYSMERVCLEKVEDLRQAIREYVDTQIKQAGWTG
jgi:hypothetical protein